MNVPFKNQPRDCRIGCLWSDLFKKMVRSQFFSEKKFVFNYKFLNDH